MKHLLFAIALILSVALARAEVKTIVLKADIHCDNCVKRVMTNQQVLGEGISNVSCDLESQTITVAYDSQKNSPEKIIEGLKAVRVKAKPAKDAPACNKNAGKAAVNPMNAAAKHQNISKLGKENCGEGKHECSKDAKAVEHKCSKEAAGEHKCSKGEGQQCEKAAGQHKCSKGEGQQCEKHKCSKGEGQQCEKAAGEHKCSKGEGQQCEKAAGQHQCSKGEGQQCEKAAGEHQCGKGEGHKCSKEAAAEHQCSKGEGHKCEKAAGEHKCSKGEGRQCEKAAGEHKCGKDAAK